MKKFFLAALAALAWTQVSAQVTINFSGGGGTPLTVTLPNAITFTRTDADTKGNLYFIIPSLTGGGTSFSSASSTYTVQVNGGAPVALTNIQGAYGVSGFILGQSGIATYNGDTVVLNAGSFTTSANYAGTYTSGSYNIHIVDSNTGAIESAAAVSAVPEPSTYAAIFGAMALGAVAVIRQRRRAVAVLN